MNLFNVMDYLLVLRLILFTMRIALLNFHVQESFAVSNGSVNCVGTLACYRTDLTASDAIYLRGHLSAQDSILRAVMHLLICTFMVVMQEIEHKLFLQMVALVILIIQTLDVTLNLSIRYSAFTEPQRITQLQMVWHNK